MGGGADVVNATAAAEFNVFHDPEAAAIVLDACAAHGVPVTTYGLDVFYAPVVTDRHVTWLREVGSGPAIGLALLLPLVVEGTKWLRRRGAHARTVLDVGAATVSSGGGG
jgi:inosine-uridine nucleoside N-ribohydrolase